MRRQRLGLWRVSTALAQSKPKGRPYHTPRVPRMTPKQYAERQRILHRNGKIIGKTIQWFAVAVISVFMAGLLAAASLAAFMFITRTTPFSTNDTYPHQAHPNK
jgi:uncharacterized MAPEG superfamily protein